LPCERLPPENALAAIERAAFLSLLVTAGLAPLVWSGLQLAVVHLCVPHAGRLEPAAGIGAEPAVLADEPEIALPRNPWEDAKCFWYDVTEPAH
jgi:hypothetical protein